LRQDISTLKRYVPDLAEDNFRRHFSARLDIFYSPNFPLFSEITSFSTATPDYANCDGAPWKSALVRVPSFFSFWQLSRLKHLDLFLSQGLDAKPQALS
jgi:hypothetical protein